jgi:3'-phosphoadenosine 5'-phosphosulfate sulfotransferase (PAPS reductase)/FAD synthetase
MIEVRNKTIVVWFSCGAASAVAAKITLELYGEHNNVLIVNTPIQQEHHDNQRFLQDIQQKLQHPILTAINPEYPHGSITEIFDQIGLMKNREFAPCTHYLKVQSRFHFEKTHKIDYHVMGFTVDEWERQKKFSMMERKSLPVLVSQLTTKKECFDIISKWGVQLPEMYKLGFKNSNCMGCVKASSPAYWNMIRKYFPDVFEQRVQQSRKHGCKLVVLKQKRIFLDELPNDALGGKLGEWECGLFCDTY